MTLDDLLETLCERRDQLKIDRDTELYIYHNHEVKLRFRQIALFNYHLYNERLIELGWVVDAIATEIASRECADSIQQGIKNYLEHNEDLNPYPPGKGGDKDDN